MIKRIIITAALIFAVLTFMGRKIEFHTYELDTMFELETNQKLEFFTWVKGNHIMYITNQMKEDDVAERYVFQQLTESAILVESKEEQNHE